MKVLIILALVACVVADWKPIPRDELKQFRLKCSKSANLSVDQYEKIKKLEYEDNDAVKEFVLCGARSSEMWDDATGWLPDRVLQMLEGDSSLSKEEITNIIKGCLDANSQKSSLKDWAFRDYKCLLESQLKDDFIKQMKKIE